MAKKIFKNMILILLCAYSLFFVAASILSPVLAHYGKYEISAQLTTLFMYSCHQAPDRSFWLMGYPVALCCRCLGFYIGVSLFSIIDLFGKLKLNLKTFIILLSIVCIDIIINYGFGIRAHNTGNILRFIVGIIMGLIFITIIKYIFERKKS